METGQRRSWLLEQGIRVIAAKPVSESWIQMPDATGRLVELRPVDVPEAERLAAEAKRFREAQPADELDQVDDLTDVPCQPNDLGFCKWCGKEMTATQSD